MLKIYLIKDLHNKLLIVLILTTHSIIKFHKFSTDKFVRKGTVYLHLSCNYVYLIYIWIDTWLKSYLDIHFSNSRERLI